MAGSFRADLLGGEDLTSIPVILFSAIQEISGLRGPSPRAPQT